MTTTAQTATSPDALLTALKWRYAVKKFDATKKIDATAWKALEESLALAPSSYGIQPWAFFVVDTADLRAKLKPVSWNQTQITDAARLVVFAGRTEMTAEDIERFSARIAEVRGQTAADVEPYKKMMMEVVKRPAPVAQEWIARQVYIALGVFLTAAATLGIDACPMEGIDPAQYDTILGLKAKGYRTIVVATAGYRAADDKYASAAKVRFPTADVVRHL